MDDRNMPRLIPITHWNRYHDYPSIAGLRHLTFHEKTNGFDTVVRRIGRRVLINEQAFFAWVERAGSSHGTH